MKTGETTYEEWVQQFCATFRSLDPAVPLTDIHGLAEGAWHRGFHTVDPTQAARRMSAVRPGSRAPKGETP
jgi:hypothetical protein